MTEIVLHRGKTNTGSQVEGFITKMWGTYHIIPIDDENTAYEVEEESIEPIIN